MFRKLELLNFGQVFFFFFPSCFIWFSEILCWDRLHTSVCQMMTSALAVSAVSKCRLKCKCLVHQQFTSVGQYNVSSLDCQVYNSRIGLGLYKNTVACPGCIYCIMYIQAFTFKGKVRLVSGWVHIYINKTQAWSTPSANVSVYSNK